MPTVFRAHIKCYRCSVEEHGEAFATEAEAQGAIRDFMEKHRRSCGEGASFSHGISTMTMLDEGKLELGPQRPVV